MSNYSASSSVDYLAYQFVRGFCPRQPEFGPIYDNEYYWRLKADLSRAKCWMYQATFYINNQ